MSIRDVQEFNQKFDLADGTDTPDHLSDDVLSYRVDLIEEELSEFIAAHAPGGRLEEAFDALLDLTYIVYGTALMMGVSPDAWEDGFSEVHRCNLMKERTTDISETKRKHLLDLIKPPGWQGPEQSLVQVLQNDR